MDPGLAAWREQHSPIDDHFPILPKHLRKTIMSMHTRPAQVECQNGAIGEFDGTDCVIRIAPFCEFRVTGILTSCEYSVDLFVGCGGVGDV